MKNKRLILVCDNEESLLTQLQSDLEKDDFTVHILKNAADLVATAERLQPMVIVANPDMDAFNEYDVCKKIQQQQSIRVILMLDPGSTRRARIGECDADDVVTKPVDVSNLSNLLSKHISLHQ